MPTSSEDVTIDISGASVEVTSGTQSGSGLALTGGSLTVRAPGFPFRSPEPRLSPAPASTPRAAGACLCQS